MTLRRAAVFSLAAVILCALLLPGALAQAPPREMDFAARVDAFYSSSTSEANRQRFFSILIFVVLGSAATYAQLRGIKKVVSVD